MEIIEHQLEIIVKDDNILMVLEAVYNDLDSHWYWKINGIDTGFKILRYEAQKLIYSNKISAKIVLKAMLDSLKDISEPTNFQQKQIRTGSFTNIYAMELIKQLGKTVYPELLI